MSFAATNWNAIGAIASIAGVMLAVLGFLFRVLWRALMAEIGKISKQVTPPPLANGHEPVTLAKTTTDLDRKLDRHIDRDDVRFQLVWERFGEREPHR
jgi:hypothetical protein